MADNLPTPGRGLPRGAVPPESDHRPRGARPLTPVS